MEELKKCKDCGAEAQLISCNLGYFVECSKLGHLHNGEKIYRTPARSNRRMEQEGHTKHWEKGML